MRIYNMHEAKTHLSRLVREAVAGDPFVIARSGKPLVKVVSVEAPEPEAVRRTGFMRGQISVPDDFDTMGAKGILATFEGGE
ncbi:MAG: type II toxin-antitoxin system prevent-host-death family antitoxin [Gemmatimonadota bacterium]|nr:type II toxin-antitoxin system prevent-host-death family antitoxin [Gemmatimonadota bacterium]MDE2783080.1 type II toxin-antitoxin system prevent-host-death family antitoxin [Gemmatimonadota bacterium]MDE2863837.1 type II toxin-antitoxin system prevent-host-death family antitoxin [Gemmatimonadota bacterium]MYB05266.1 type II toxin-antitoxin system prevent-host-death family antitoxin [Gemmatimonadota bacterium]MYG22079.1 type II toxin-antitoxin system prevent-host-death family antitoxin [Gemm